MINMVSFITISPYLVEIYSYFNRLLIKITPEQTFRFLFCPAFKTDTLHFIDQRGRQEWGNQFVDPSRFEFMQIGEHFGYGMATSGDHLTGIQRYSDLRRVKPGWLVPFVILRAVEVVQFVLSDNPPQFVYDHLYRHFSHGSRLLQGGYPSDRFPQQGVL